MNNIYLKKYLEIIYENEQVELSSQDQKKLQNLANAIVAMPQSFKKCLQKCNSGSLDKDMKDDEDIITLLKIIGELQKEQDPDSQQFNDEILICLQRNVN